MKHLRILLSKFRYHPLHIILGIITVIVGVALIFDDHYFFWPPGFDSWYNSDFIGSWAFFTGLGIIYVAIQRFIPSNANTIWLLSECGFAGTMSGLEITHGIVKQNDHMILFGIVLLGYLLFTLYIIRVNGTNDHKIIKRIRERDKKIEGR